MKKNNNYENYVWIEEMGFADAENEHERTFLALTLATHHPLHGCEMYNCGLLRKELVGAVKHEADQKGKLVSTNGLRETLEERIRVYCELWLKDNPDMRTTAHCGIRDEVCEFSPTDFFNYKKTLRCKKCRNISK